MFTVNISLKDQESVVFKFSEKNFLKSLRALYFFYEDQLNRDYSRLGNKGNESGLELLSLNIFGNTGELKKFSAWGIIKEILWLQSEMKDNSDNPKITSSIDKLRGAVCEGFMVFLLASLPKLNGVNNLTAKLNPDNILEVVREIMTIRSPLRKGDWVDYDKLIRELSSTHVDDLIIKAHEEGSLEVVILEFDLSVVLINQWIRKNDNYSSRCLEAYKILIALDLIEVDTISSLLSEPPFSFNQMIELMKASYLTNSLKFRDAFAESGRSLDVTCVTHPELAFIFIETSRDLLFLLSKDELRYPSRLLSFLLRSFKTDSPLINEAELEDLLCGPLSSHMDTVIDVLCEDAILAHRLPRLFRKAVLARGADSKLSEYAILKIDPNITIQLLDIDYSSTWQCLDVDALRDSGNKTVVKYFLNKNISIVKQMATFNWVSEEGKLNSEALHTDSWAMPFRDFSRCLKVAQELGMPIEEEVELFNSSLNKLLEVVNANLCLKGGYRYSKKSEARDYVASVAFGAGEGLFKYDKEDKKQKRALKAIAKSPGMGQHLLGLDNYLTEKERTQFFTTFGNSKDDIETVLRVSKNNSELERYFNTLIEKQNSYYFGRLLVREVYYDEMGEGEYCLLEVMRFLLIEKGVELKSQNHIKIALKADLFIQKGIMFKELFSYVKEREHLKSLLQLFTSGYNGFGVADCKVANNFLSSEQKNSLMNLYLATSRSRFGGPSSIVCADDYLKLKKQAYLLGLTSEEFDSLLSNEPRTSWINDTVCGIKAISWLFIVRDDDEESKIEKLRKRGFCVEGLEDHPLVKALIGNRFEDKYQAGPGGFDPILGRAGTIEFFSYLVAKGDLNRITKRFRDSTLVIPDSTDYTSEVVNYIIKEESSIILDSFCDETLKYYSLDKKKIIEDSDQFNYFDHLVKFNSDKQLRQSKIADKESGSRHFTRDSLYCFKRKENYAMISAQPSSIESLVEDLPKIIEAFEVQEEILPSELMVFMFKNSLKRAFLVDYMTNKDLGPQFIRDESKRDLISYLNEDELIDFFINLEYSFSSILQEISSLGLDKNLAKKILQESGECKLKIRGREQLQEYITLLGEETITKALESESEHFEIDLKEGVYLIEKDIITEGIIRTLREIPVARMINGKLLFKSWVPESIRIEVDKYHKKARISGNFNAFAERDESGELKVSGLPAALLDSVHLLDFTFNDYVEKVLNFSTKKKIVVKVKVHEGEAYVYPQHELMDGIANEIREKVSNAESSVTNSFKRPIDIKFKCHIDGQFKNLSTSFKKGLADVDSTSSSSLSYHNFKNPQKDQWVYFADSERRRGRSDHKGFYSPDLRGVSAMKEISSVFTRMKEDSDRDTEKAGLTDFSVTLKATKKVERDLIFKHEDAIGASNPFIKGRFRITSEARSITISFSGEKPEIGIDLFFRVMGDVLSASSSETSEEGVLAMSVSQGISRIKDPREIIDLANDLKLAL